MKEIKYNKLVRDKIPNIISEAGKQARVYKEHGDKLLAFLDKKLQEELDEYVNSREIEELADLVEVIYAILEHRGISLETFNEVRLEKNQKKGEFKEGYILVKIQED